MQSASISPRRALHEGRSFAQCPAPLDSIRWSPYPGKHPIEKGTIIEKVSKGGYERKPRKKTREDHYEYKGSTSCIQSKQSRTKAKKSSKLVRRHTINDSFHASNVTRDRLTVCIVLQQARDPLLTAWAATFAPKSRYFQKREDFIASESRRASTFSPFLGDSQAGKPRSSAWEGVFRDKILEQETTER